MLSLRRPSLPNLTRGLEQSQSVRANVGGMEKSFLTSQASANRVNKANKQRGLALVSVNTAGPIDRAPAHVTTATASDILTQVETYMDNMDVTATTNHITLDALVASTDCL